MTFPFAGESQTLHSWVPSLNQLVAILDTLAANLSVKYYDIELPLTCGGAMTSTGGVVNWARYRTLEPFAKLCHVDIYIGSITLGGTATASVYIPLPVAPNINKLATLYGVTGNGIGVDNVPVVAEGIDNIDSLLVRAQRTDNLDWTLSTMSEIRLTGWYDYGD